MISLADAAAIMYDLLDQQPVNERRYQQLFESGSRESPFFDVDSLTLAKMLRDQPRASELRRQWSKVFRSPKSPSDVQCRLFLQTLFGALEYWGNFSFGKIEAGLTCSVRDTLADFHTHRVTSNFGWNIQLTTEGSGTINCVRQTLTSTRGDVFIFSPEGLLDYGRTSGCENWIHHWVFFQPEEQWQSLLRLQEVGPGIYHVHIGKQGSYEKLLSLFSEIKESRYSTDSFNIQLATNLLEELLIRCQQAMPGGKRVVWDVRIEKAVQYLRGNYHLPLTVDDVAGDMGISSSRLAVLFKQQTGRSVLAYRDDIRMGRACHLLASTNLSVTQVAQDVGYLDSQYFSRQFKKCLRESPRSYRNRLNNR